MNQQLHYEQRRVFRGRSGPTDRRLPKQNARRRRAPKISKAEDDHEDHVQTTTTHGNTVHEDYEEPRHLESINNDVSMKDSDSDIVIDEHRRAIDNQGHQFDEQPNCEECKKELDHLHQRIKNNRIVMQNSKAIANPDNYRVHVLDATRNTIREWRSIVKTYYNSSESQDHRGGVDGKEWKTNGQAIFDLVQHALSCGPLQGAKPGYMKRCGGEVAGYVSKFLHNAICHCLDDSNCSCCRDLLWTEKQQLLLQKWKRDSGNAVAKDAAPSKSNLKRQQKAGQGKTKKK